MNKVKRSTGDPAIGSTAALPSEGTNPRRKVACAHVKYEQRDDPEFRYISIYTQKEDNINKRDHKWRALLLISCSLGLEAPCDHL